MNEYEHVFLDFHMNMADPVGGVGLPRSFCFALRVTRPCWQMAGCARRMQEAQERRGKWIDPEVASRHGEAFRICEYIITYLCNSMYIYKIKHTI